MRRSLAVLLLTGLGASFFAAPAAAQVVPPIEPPRFTVTTEQDTLEVGSLRWVIVNANGESGQTIGFEIPGDGDGVIQTPIVQVTRNILANTSNATINGSVLELVTIRAAGTNPAEIIVLDIDGNATVVTVKDIRYERGQILIGASTGLVYEVTGERDLTTSSAITGDGNFTKGGAGTLRFDAVNTYTGGTTVTGGILVGNTNSIPVAAGSDVRSGATLRFDQSFDASYAGPVIGTGTLEKIGGGVLTFTELDDYDGSFLVSGGTLVVDSALTPSGDVTISTGTFEFKSPSDTTFAGSLGGSGTFDKNNGAAAITFNDGDFTGVLRVRDGEVTDAANVIRGSVSLDAATSILVFKGDGSNEGIISGDGSLRKTGDGTFTLDGNNTYLGGANIEAGELVVRPLSLPGETFLVPGASLVFDHPDDEVFAGDVIGSFSAIAESRVAKRGSGRMRLDGKITATELAVEAGRLDVDGRVLAQDIVVGPQGTLGGREEGAGPGTVTGIRAPIRIQGTLAPGHPLPADNDTTAPTSGGTLRVEALAGSPAIAFESSGRFAPVVESGGGGGKVLVEPNTATEGIVETGGADIQIALRSGDYRSGSNVAVLTAPTIVGQFVDASLDFAFQDVAITYALTPSAMADDVLSVNVQRNSSTFTDFGVTPNQDAVAFVMDQEEAALPSTPSGSDFESVLFSLLVLEDDEVAPALDSLSGEYLSQFVNMRLATGEQFQRTVQRRMYDGLREVDAFWAAGFDSGLPTFSGLPEPTTSFAAARGVGALLPMAASAVTVVPIEEQRKPLGLWLDGYGLFGKLDGDSNAAASRYTLWGISTGFDGHPADRWTLGGAAGYANTGFTVGARDSAGSGNAFQAALYGGYTAPRYRGGLSFRYAYTSNRGDRRIAFSDVDRVADTSFGSHDYGLRAEGGVNVLRIGTFAFEPGGAFDWARLSQPSFSETGADSLNLLVEGQDFDSLILQLGARIHGRIDMDEDTGLMPEFRFFWLHEFGDDTRVVDARFTGGLTGLSFSTTGASFPRDAALLGMGWTASLGANSDLALNYDAIVGSGVLQNNVSLTFRFRF